jgi:hypothetical protein
MELLTVQYDYCVQKVQAIALFADVKVSIRSGVTHEELLGLHPQAKSMVLKHNGEYLAQHNSILRYIAYLKPETRLGGSTEFDKSQVIYLLMNILQF